VIRRRTARNELRQIAAQERIEDHVRFEGFLLHEELIDAYLDHHVLLSPSVRAANRDNEGGAPVTLIEASATGMPIVSTWHCDIPEVVQHRDTGLLAEEGDVEPLAAHLSVLHEEPDKLTELGAAAHEHVADEHNARKQGKRLDRIYASL